MDKILTVVIPTYNMERYLRKCLDSLIIEDKDLFDTLEVLIVNDGSKDSSSAIAHEYQNKYPNVFRVIDKENGNYGSCVNRGLKEATGKYFRILDADDWFDASGLASFLVNLLTCNSDIVFTNYTKQFANGSKQKVVNNEFHINELYVINDIMISARSSKTMLVMHTMTHRTDLLRKIGLKLQTGISYTDIEYCYFPLSRAQTLIFLDINLYQYFIGRDGQTMQRENIIRDIDHLNKVAIRVVEDFIYKSECINWRMEALIDIISNPIYQLYLVFLIYSKSVSPELENIINSLERLVEETPSLRERINNYTYRKIPFVRIWKSLHFRIGSVFGK